MPKSNALLAWAWSQHQEALFLLDGRNFTWAMRAYPRMMLFFYAPWCGHSRGVEPEVKKAAELLQGNVAFAKIDASLEVEVAEEFGLSAYPGLFLVQKGGFEEFGGRRAGAAIVDWVRSKVGPALEVVDRTDQLQASGSTGLQEILTRIAEKNRDWGRFYFLKDTDANQVSVLRGLSEFVDAPFEVDIDRQALEPDILSFIQAEKLPVLGEISEENFYHYETSGAEALLWVIFANNTGLPCWADQCRQQAQEHQKSLRSIATEFPQIKARVRRNGPSRAGGEKCGRLSNHRTQT